MTAYVQVLVRHSLGIDVGDTDLPLGDRTLYKLECFAADLSSVAGRSRATSGLLWSSWRLLLLLLSATGSLTLKVTNEYQSMTRCAFL
jgi:hypothetical protein